MYWALFNARGLTGLAIASDIGIFIQTATLAILLHRKRLVSLLHLEYTELARALAAALLAFVAAYASAQAVTRTLPNLHGHKADLLIITAGSLAWALAAFVVLLALRSRLPAQVLRRKTA
jgi:putative peptidoglycan lipid II flippase